MPRLTVRHTTTYRYSCPVAFGEHRMMFRPRDSHNLRLIGTMLAITPQPDRIRWIYDVFGNSVAYASFAPDTPAAELTFESGLDLEHFESTEPTIRIEDYAQTYPFSYAAEEAPDLSRLIERHYADPDHAVDLWAKGFVRTDGPTGTEELLADIALSVKSEFRYAGREEEGVQDPAETLARRSGSCRDYALLMMEAVRSLGFAARFVSGYLYSPNADGGGHVGGGATHAWVEIYLPGAGWVEYDPTNGIVGHRDLIRVAVARDPSQAAPLSGSYSGPSNAFLGMAVDVSVTSPKTPDAMLRPATAA